MTVQIKYNTKMRHFSERVKRSTWLRERIPSHEYMIHTPSCEDEDGYDLESILETTVTIWDEDAEKIATEFWFRFP